MNPPLWIDLMQKPLPDPNHIQLGHHLVATWTKGFQAMGPEYEPYLPVVMPSLLTTEGAKADL